jgi:hypothetical protein
MESEKVEWFAGIAKHDIEGVVYTAAEPILTGNASKNRLVSGCGINVKDFFLPSLKSSFNLYRASSVYLDARALADEIEWLLNSGLIIRHLPLLKEVWRLIVL